MKATVALVDDHALLRRGLATLLKDLGYQVAFEAGHGKEFLEKLKTHPLPNVVLMDINMPQMDGYETTLWLKNNHSSVKVLVLSMLDDDTSIIRMFRSGAKGYILKDCDPDELDGAIQSLLRKDFYHSEAISGKLIRAINHLDDSSNDEDKSNGNAAKKIDLTEKEQEFLNWICTELSYKEIADKMHLSPRTVEGYRDNLQEKFDCRGRIGLVLWAIKNGIVTV